MHVEITEEPLSHLGSYATVPIAFEVRSVLEPSLIQGGLGGVLLEERVLDAPYVKDYDRIAGCSPDRWGERFDTSSWRLLAARAQGTLVGGAALAFHTRDLEMLQGRRDLAVLWDLRVAPRARHSGVGTALFQAAAAQAKRRGCVQLKVETQNVNVPACRFYARQGCELGAIHRFAYPFLPDEIQLLWYKDLA